MNDAKYIGLDVASAYSACQVLINGIIGNWLFRRRATFRGAKFQALGELVGSSRCYHLPNEADESNAEPIPS